MGMRGARVGAGSLRRLPQVVGRSMALTWQAGRREFAVAAILQTVAGVAIVLQLLLVRRLLDVALGDVPDLAAARWLLLALVATTAVVGFSSVARAEQQRVLADLVGRHAIDKVLAVAAAAPLIAFETPGFHDRVERAKINAVTRPHSVATGTLGLVGSGFAVLGIGATLLLLQPLFVALVVLASVPAWWASVHAGRALHEFAAAYTERDRRRSYLLVLLTGKTEAQEVRANEIGGYLRDRHDELYAERIAGMRRLARRRLQLGLAGAVVTSTLGGATLMLLLLFVTSGRMSVPAAGTVAAAVVLLGQRTQGVARALAALHEGALFVEDFTRFVDEPPAFEPERAGIAPTAVAPITARELTFTYPSRHEPSLRGVSLDIGPGEVVALVGRNGSGKTTLAKVLAGLLEPGRGTVAWAGTDIARCDPRLLRERVAIIFQDFVRYHLSARDNIAIGRHERFDDAAAVRAAARRVGIDEELRALPDGYATVLGPQYYGGSELSGGQWQRMALARAFFRDAPFVILDEPTAALDARAEAELFDDLRELCAGRSVLLISHRLASVRSADRIYVLRDGVIIEQGRHDELLGAGGHYAELFTLQASPYQLSTVGQRSSI